ncbi:MAG TPA: uroporphyrinogen-III synthase [Terriglobales bacterium]|nr:uroporphyrinogen-III synthase [Terriglobales bacterium]
MTSHDGAGPLTGVRVLVGRARHQASALSSGLRAIGAEVIEIPFIEIRKPRSYKPFDAALTSIANYDWLILTSVNGVEAVAGRIKHLRIRPAALAHLKIAAIGPATQKRIEELGLKVSVVPRRYVAESVVESLRGKVKGKRVLLARARVARDVIPSELRKVGARVDVVEAYETVVPESSRREVQRVMNDPATRPQVIAFTSSSSVRNFVELLRGQECPRHMVVQGIKLASIGPVTSATLRELELPVQIEATEYTVPGLAKAIGEAMTPINLDA